MTHALEVAGCLVVLALFVAGLLAAARWLDDQGEPEDWWGYGE